MTYMYKGKILNLRKDIIERNNEPQIREVVEHHGGVGIALEDDDGSFFFVTQHRYAVDEVTLEFPAGKKEVGESALDTAKREIVEETGYSGKDWFYLGKIYPTPAYDTEIIDLYYAKKDKYLGQHLDSDEDITLTKLTLSELNEKILNQEIPDAKTVSMSLLLQLHKNKGII